MKRYLFFIFTTNKKTGRRLSWFIFETILSNTVIGFHMKITFTLLDTQKTPENSDSLKPTPKSQKTENQTEISVVVTARPRLGKMYKLCPHKGREINCWDNMREPLYTFSLAVRGQNCPHLWVSKVLELRATKVTCHILRPPFLCWFSRLCVFLLSSSLLPIFFGRSSLLSKPFLSPP